RAAAMLYRDHLDRQPLWDDHVRTVLTYQESGEQVLCHRDPTPGNWLCGSTLQLIDWEYASLGDRWFDLAALIEGWDWSDAKARLTTQAYVDAAGTTRGIEQLPAARAAYRALVSLWVAASPVIA
ncbi:MAG: phosphotransferase, partial [Pseudomonadota bacterium]